MKRSEAFPSKFLKADDLNGGDLTVTISSVEWEEVGKDKTQKPVIYFRGKVKPLICNGTNWDRIAKITGEDDSDEWAEYKITLGVEEVRFGREDVPAIRVRIPKAAKAKAKAEPEPDEEAADPEDD
jgi:hypothetical protein